MNLLDRLAGHLESESPPPWEQHDLDIDGVLAAIDQWYPRAGEEVCGLRVAEFVPNLSSIEASLYEWHEFGGIRALPFTDFGGPRTVFHAADDFERARRLCEEIRESGWIAPLIIVVDAEGPYILEGCHRFVALHYMGVTHFPAVLIADVESLVEAIEARSRLGPAKPSPPEVSRESRLRV